MTVNTPIYVAAMPPEWGKQQQIAKGGSTILGNLTPPILMASTPSVAASTDLTQF
jgi:hypothetical protein